MRNAYFQVGEHLVYGAAAEILSVLEDSAVWSSAGRSAVGLENIAAALDTRTPAEERTPLATKVVQLIQKQRPVARWIPWYPSLAFHEYRNEFYDAYRDHTIHTLAVYLLGIYIYETVTPLREALDRRFGKYDRGMEAIDLFLEWWTLTSLWHDIGYPFESTGFIDDSAVRTHQLAAIADELNRDIFLAGFHASGAGIGPSDARLVYQHGGFYPIAFTSTEDLLDRALAPQAIDRMWRRLGVGLRVDSVAREFDRITTQSPIGRPPYHDHGLWGSMLLGLCYEEAETFLGRLSQLPESPVTSRVSPYRKTADTSWINVAGAERLVQDALEAIAFHNVNWTAIDAKERTRLLDGGLTPMVGLDSEPHLFFLALADTLQDWDRHHFLPNSDARYRPAVRSTDMLLQGTGEHLRVSIKDRPSPATDIKRLFHGWLDLGALIQEQARFTRGDKLLSGAGLTVSAEDVSARERARLEKVVERSVAEAKRLLIESAEDAVISAAARMEAALRQVQDSRKLLSKSDSDRLDAAIQTSGIRQTENQAFALIGPGTRLGLGKVDAEIGHGGFGVVYRVISEDRAGSRRDYAFKLFHNRDLDLIDKRRLFRRGYDAMKQLEGNKHIVQVYRFSELPVGFYMDYVPGTDLETIDPRRFGTLSDRLSLLLTVASTLAFAHSRGVLHRDIKPGNVLLDDRLGNCPVLTDFDLAWIDGRTHNTKVQYATANYGAPEQFEDRLKAWHTKPTVDVYGFGALAYYIISHQKPPFHGRWTDELWGALERRIRDDVPAAVARDLIKLVQHCTTFDPAKRMNDMDIVADSLAAAIASVRSAGQGLSRDAWLAEVQTNLVGQVVAERSRTLKSQTGGTTWFFDKEHEVAGGITMELRCQLNREPAYEGVNFTGFTKSSMRHIDGRLRDFESRWSGARTERKGHLGSAGSSIGLTIRNVPRTIVSGAAVGQLLASITRAIE